VYVAGGTNTTNFNAPTDGTNTYTLQSSALDTVNIEGLARYITGPVSAGSYTVTANFGTSLNALAVLAIEVPNTGGQLASLAGNYQSAPGTGAGAIVTGTGTFSSQLALVNAVTITTSGAAGVSAAAGWTAIGGIWSNIKANFGYLIQQQLTAASIAGQWTTVNGSNPQVSIGGAWSQPVPPITLMGQILT
jgi:hypothetical protein